MSLELIDLHKRYGDVAALDGLTMTVAAGRMHGFVGRNGAGKTTAMRVALGLVDPDAGTVRWRGAAPGVEDRRRFGYMPEERGLYPKMRLVDQVAYFGELSGMAGGDARREAERRLRDLGLGDRLTDAAETLSQGNQQRVQLAAALVQGPDLLVLDEPFNGLDPVGVDVLSGVLRDRVEAGAAVVFSSHQLELVERLCDEVTIVDEGRVVAAGAIGALRREHAHPVLRIELAGGDTAWASPPTGLPVMPIRQAAGELPLWEAALGVALVLATIAVAIPLAGRIYAGGALFTRGRLRLRDAYAGGA